MTVPARLAVTVAFLLGLTTSLAAQDVVHTLHLNRPVSGIARTAGQLFSDNDRLRIVGDEETNTLIVRGPDDVVAQAVTAIRELDRPRQLVTISLSMSLSGAGDPADEEITFTTPDEQRIRIALRQTVPVVSGITVIAGREIRNTSPENVGTHLEATPRIMGDKIALKLFAEKAWLEAEEADDIPPTKSESRIDTTVELTPGEPQTFQVKVNGSPAREMSVTVAAAIGTRAPAIPRREGPGSSAADARRNRSADVIFRGYDANEDGKISQREFNTNSRLSPTLIQRGFEFQDGINQEEFRVQFKKSMPLTSSLSSSGGTPSRTGRTNRSGRTGRGATPDPDRGPRMAGYLFAQLDSNEDGKLSQSEWDSQPSVTDLLDSRFEFRDGMTKEQLGAALNGMYSNQSQSPLGYQRPDPSATPEERAELAARRMFPLLDRDGNGTVTKDEWEKSGIRGLMQRQKVQFKEGFNLEYFIGEIIRVNRETQRELNERRKAREPESEKPAEGSNGGSESTSDPAVQERARQIAGFLFKRFDSNNDSRISQQEWDAQAVLSKSYSERGFEFTEGMTKEQFAKEIEKTLPQSAN